MAFASTPHVGLNELKPEKVQLEEGRQRWWHGPIDLIIGVEGAPDEVGIGRAHV